jgi:hypothetical protein
VHGVLPLSSRFNAYEVHHISFDTRRDTAKAFVPDCQIGGYNLEGSGLRRYRLIKMILLMAIVYTSAIFQGTEIQKKQVQKYVYRHSQARKNTEDGVH